MEPKMALVVGISNYTDFPLKYCENDAEEISSILQAPEYGFKVTTLINEDATRRKIIEELKKTFSKETKFALFYFAGHGISIDIGTFLVTHDSDEIDPGIDLDYLKRMLVKESSNKTNALLILDCCHSGAATIRTSQIQAKKARPIRNDDVSDRFYDVTGGKVILAACQPENFAYEEPDLKHGVFTYNLLQGMIGDAADSEGNITIFTLAEFVSQKFKESTDQRPVFKGDVIGQLILGKNLKPRNDFVLPDKELIEIEVKAKKLMNEYIRITSVDIESWKKSQYREASSRLSPIIEWLNKQAEEYPILLRTYDGFKTSYATAKNKLADLARLEENLNTPIGVVKSRIGSGTFGTVWHIIDDKGQDIAYKVYHPNELENQEKLQRFKRGYRAMNQLDHPHIVKVYKYTECPLGFIMDFISGPNVRDFIPGVSDFSEIIPQLLTVAETLQHTHSREVIHRDVKPENIIMQWDEKALKHRPYLTDFDLSWFSTATQFTKEAIGSWTYAAPEQIAKPNTRIAHAKTTDVFAFGQLLFFFICKRDPVYMLADNSQALSKELQNLVFEEPARMLVSLYQDCTNQDPLKRAQDFREICDRLYEINVLINETDHQKPLDFEAYASELCYSIVGLSPERIKSANSFRTTSGRTLVEITLDHGHRIIFRLEVLSPLALEGASGHKAARESINQRIDTSLAQYKNVQRKSGKKHIYETFIILDRIPLNIDGVELSRQILTRVIDCIEQA